MNVVEFPRVVHPWKFILATTLLCCCCLFSDGRSANEKRPWTTVPSNSTIADATNWIPRLNNASRECRIPELVGDWQRGKKYRFPVAEAQGAMLQDTHTLVVVGGFLNGFRRVTRRTYTLDTSRRWSVWKRQDNQPMGITHAATVVVGTRLYMCGGYVGGSPGPHTDACLVFNVSGAKTPNSQSNSTKTQSTIGSRRSQWSRLASLPDGGRAGGGMIYDTAANALVFAAGAQRHENNQRDAVDFNTTWLFALDQPEAGWIVKAPIPYLGNHVSSVTAVDEFGHQRHFFTGGQEAENEADGNSLAHYEYNVLDNVWTARKFMTIPRGHASSSTRAMGCGYFVAAGSTNGGQKLSDISYYDIPTDTWTSIGNLPAPISTPVCDWSESRGMLYCESGFDNRRFSYKIPIVA